MMIILSKILNRYLALFIRANVQVECGGGSADAECVQPSRWHYCNKSPCEYPGHIWRHNAHNCGRAAPHLKA